MNKQRFHALEEFAHNYYELQNSHLVIPIPFDSRCSLMAGC